MVIQSISHGCDRASKGYQKGATSSLPPLFGAAGPELVTPQDDRERVAERVVLLTEQRKGNGIIRWSLQLSRSRINHETQ